MSNRRQKIQILTLTQNSWSLRIASQEFNVTQMTIAKVRRLRDEKGIIELPEQIKGKQILL